MDDVEVVDENGHREYHRYVSDVNILDGALVIKYAGGGALYAPGRWKFVKIEEN